MSLHALENVFDEVVRAAAREVANVARGVLRFRRVAVAVVGGPGRLRASRVGLDQFEASITTQQPWP